MARKNEDENKADKAKPNEASGVPSMVIGEGAATTASSGEETTCADEEAVARTKEGQRIAGIKGDSAGQFSDFEHGVPGTMQGN